MAKNPFQLFRDRIPAPLRSRYVLVLVLFLIWMTSFDRFDIFTQVKISQTAEQLQQENDHYQKSIAETKQKLSDLERNIEKFAREQYFFKKGNEDIFVIVEEE